MVSISKSSIERPIAYRVSGKCWVNNHAHVLKPKKDSLDVDYLCYSLMFYNTDGNEEYFSITGDIWKKE